MQWADMKCSSILLGLSEPFTLENFPTTQSSESFNLNWKYFDIVVKWTKAFTTNLWRVQIFRSLLLSSLRVSIPPSNSECTIVTDDITRFIQIVCRRPQLWAVSNASNIKLKKLYLYLWWVLDLNPFLSRNFEDSPFWKLDFVVGGSTF